MHELTFDEISKQVGAPRLIIDALDERVLDAHATPCSVGILPSRTEHLTHGPARIHRDEGVAQVVVRGMQGYGQGHGKTLPGELLHPRHEPDSGNGDAASAHPQPVRSRRDEPANSTDHR